LIQWKLDYVESQKQIIIDVSVLWKVFCLFLVMVPLVELVINSYSSALLDFRRIWREV
jgi:hypothetical protein